MPALANPCLDAALDYLRRGWSALCLCPPDHEGVSPVHQRECHSPGKAPLYGWLGQTEKPCQPKTLEVQFRRLTGCNVGIALGPVSGLIGVDVDGIAGAELLAVIAGGPANIPETLAFTTPNLGQRLFYQHPAGEALPNKVIKIGKKEAIKVLSKGTETVMPPSIIERRDGSGPGEYCWLDGCRPGEIEPTEAPAWLVKLAHEGYTPRTGLPEGGHAARGEPASGSRLAPPETPPPGRLSVEERARIYLANSEPCHREGNHPEDASTHLLRMATALRFGFGLLQPVAATLLQEYDQRTTPAPFGEQQCIRKVAQCKCPGNREHGYLLADTSSRIPAQAYNDRHTQEEDVSTTAERNGHTETAPRMPAKPAATKKPRARPVLIDGQQLMTEEFPEMRWAVQGVIPEGCALLAGRPKMGKSWLALGAALAVANGGVALGRIPVERGEVLYLALEDGPRRLQKRLQTLLAADSSAMPPGVSFATQWPRTTEGGLDEIERWLDEHPAARLIVTDTLARVRDKRVGDSGIYEEDYAAIAQYQTQAMERSIAHLMVHHTRKPKSGSGDDPLDEVQNSTGLTGAADVVLVLKRARYAREARLAITGKDVDERELNLQWDPRYCHWQMLDDPGVTDAESKLPEEQRKVRIILRSAGKPLGIMDIHNRMPEGREYMATAQLCHRMVRDGLLVKSGYGRYDLPQDKSGQTSQSEQQDVLPL